MGFARFVKHYFCFFLILFPKVLPGWLFRTIAGNYRSGSCRSAPLPLPLSLRSRVLFYGDNRGIGNCRYARQNPEMHTPLHKSQILRGDSGLCLQENGFSVSQKAPQKLQTSCSALCVRPRFYHLTENILYTSYKNFRGMFFCSREILSVQKKDNGGTPCRGR